MRHMEILLTSVDDIPDGDRRACLHLAQLLEDELAQLRSLLDVALEAQWLPAGSRAEGEGRSKGTISNPTMDIALDGRRLALRAQVLKSERLLRDTAITVRGVRRGLERTLDEWEGA